MIEDAYHAGLVRFPLEKATFWAVRGNGCWYRRDGRPPRKAALQHESNRVLTTPSLSDAWQRRLAGSGFEPVTPWQKNR